MSNDFVPLYPVILFSRTIFDIVFIPAQFTIKKAANNSDRYCMKIYSNSRKTNHSRAQRLVLPPHTPRGSGRDSRATAAPSAASPKYRSKETQQGSGGLLRKKYITKKNSDVYTVLITQNQIKKSQIEF